MRIIDSYDHLNAKEIINNNDGVLDEIISIIIKCKLRFGKNRSVEINKYFCYELNRKGWADKVKIPHSNNLTIGFIKNRIGMCIQFGNVARTYADILKLTYLYKMGLIDIGIIMVPDAIDSKLVGSNCARYDRLVREIGLFSEIIDIPIIILSLSN